MVANRLEVADVFFVVIIVYLKKDCWDKQQTTSLAISTDLKGS